MAASHVNGLARVELAKSSHSFCGWCDTAIAVGTPRVARAIGTAVGSRVEYMHAACAFHYDDGSWAKGEAHRVNCVGCAKTFAKLEQRRVVSLFSGAPPIPRFQSSTGCKPLSYCYACVAAFTAQHSDMLAGYVGARQMAASVAWRHGGTPFNLKRCKGDPPLPKGKEARVEFLALFVCADDAAEALAVARHEALRQAIEAAENSGKRRQDHWGEPSREKDTCRKQDHRGDNDTGQKQDHWGDKDKCLKQTAPPAAPTFERDVASTSTASLAVGGSSPPSEALAACEAFATAPRLFAPAPESKRAKATDDATTPTSIPRECIRPASQVRLSSHERKRAKFSEDAATPSHT